MVLGARRFERRTFWVASLIGALVCGAIVIVPQWLARQARLEVLRSHVGQIAQLAASVVDGNLQRQLIENGYDPLVYERALQPLVRFHSAYPDIFYLYTMAEVGGKTVFVLDTASSPALHSKHELRASAFMEPFELRRQYESDWLKELADGRTWMNPDFQDDDYGTFLSAHAPVYDGAGRYVGFVGVDFDLQYYLAQDARFRAIGIGSFLAAMLIAVLIGYLLARQHYEILHEMRRHYDSSLRDDLTGLLNRRGALDAIGKSLARRAQVYATLLIDIDDLKRINDTHGHATGDAVIAQVAHAIRICTREGDECARLGGDEFMIFAANCDASCALEMAQRILARVAEQVSPITNMATGVSIGIAVQDHPQASFDALYRQADAALYRGKAEGKRRVRMFEAART